MQLRLIHAACAAGLIAAPAAAIAVPPAATIVGTRTVRVSYADLDLTQSHDVSKLRKRITFAVSTVCTLPAPEHDWHHFYVDDCRKKAMETALAQFTVVVATASRMTKNDG